MFTESDRNKLYIILNRDEYFNEAFNRKLNCLFGTFYEKIEKRICAECDRLQNTIHDERVELERTIRPDIEAIKSKLGVFVDEENVKKDEKENDDSDAKYGFMLINILKLTKMVVDLDKKIETVMERLGKSKACANDEKSESDGSARKPGRRRKDA